MRKLVLRNFLSPGDIVMLTAAVRDLHKCYPRRFLTDVRTSCPGLWEHNPRLTPLDERDPDVKVIDCHYPLIDQSNHAPYHCIHGFIEFLNERLRLQIKPSVFKGDIHLSKLEKSWFSQVRELTGQDTPFWIVVAGGKYDVTIKWWDIQRYQEVIDHFLGRIVFVQVGERGHHHPKLNGVIDLRGKTDLRQLVRLVHHSQGVLCGVTALMHLAAAVEVKRGHSPNRPCVVVAGGREPVHWEAYPHHQFIHTIGALPCCSEGGCWRARSVPLGDGDERDRPGELCLDPVGGLPRCMDMITSKEVIRRIETYFIGKVATYLSRGQAKAAHRAISSAEANPFDDGALDVHTARTRSEDFVARIPRYPGGFQGRGIVICAGGPTLFTNAWVCINMLRRLGCTLPIQIWYLGKGELDQPMRSLVAPLNVNCQDAHKIRRKYPARILRGWELKPYAVIHCPYQEVLLLDADNVPIVNPTFLFETPQFEKKGAIFWPDFGRLDRSKPIWGICGIPFRDEPEFESGQLVVDKKRCWEALSLCMWYNEYSDFYYRYIHGDKETFHLAFRKVNKRYSMPRTPVQLLTQVMCQHDFAGNRMFQHRSRCKWKLAGPNKRIEGFKFEPECLEYLRDLRCKWNGQVNGANGF